MFILEYSWLVYCSIFLMGLVLGSYLNSWIWRVYEGRYEFGGRSVCVHCSRGLSWFENIPLFSYMVLRGKCRTCKKSIPWDYFMVEFATALLLLFVAVFYLNANFSSERLFRDIFFVTILLLTFVYDAKYGIILPGVMYAGIVLGFLFNYFYFGYSWVSLAVGFVFGGGFFLFQYIVSKGRWIGGGDVRLGAMMGVWLGWPNVLFAIMMSYFLGTFVALPLLAFKKKKMTSEIPFGTFLAVGTFVMIFWGERIVGWYLGLLK